MRSLLVIDVVGLTPALVGEDTPCLQSLAEEGFQAELGAVLPALTTSAQATMLTGSLPRDHGIVGNGWYFRDLAEVWLWRQADSLVAGPKVWERARSLDSSFSCAKLFWWYNMYSSVEWSVTPRPLYPADGRKIPDVYTQPAGLRDELQRELGRFPLFNFWGPGADLRSSRWIGRAAEIVLRRFRPRLALTYLPHLDYCLQRGGPECPELRRELRAVDEVAGDIVRAARELEMEVLVVSEYGITGVSGSVSINRALRREGLLAIHKALDRELLDAGASRAFAVSDHQIAHVYVKRPDDVAAVKRLLEGVDGIEAVLDRDAQRGFGLDHRRAGELVAVADRERWFDYYYWLDDSHAPDFARTVDIHRKPGYDPLELFLDPGQPLIKAKILWRLFRKALGFRYLMDVIPLDTTLVKGSHGRLPDRPGEGPVLLSSSKREQRSRLEMTEVADLMLEMMGLA